MRKPYLILIIFFISFQCITFQICESQNQPEEVAVLIKGLSNPYWKTMQDGILDKSKELGISVYIQGIQSDSDSEGQLNMCQTILLKKPKALIFAAVNSVNLSPCLKQASESGIHLIDLDGGMSEANAKKQQLKISFSVASDNLELGKKAAEYLTGTIGKVLIIEGYPGSEQGLMRVQGFKQNLPQGLEIVASLPGDWDRLKAADITTSVAINHSDLVAVFAANDLMALGAAEALFSTGLNNVKVIGIDGISDAIAAIQNGRLAASIAQLPYLIGSEALDKTIKLLSGRETYTYDQKVPVLVLDKNVLSKKQDELLQFIK